MNKDIFLHFIRNLDVKGLKDYYSQFEKKDRVIASNGFENVILDENDNFVRTEGHNSMTSPFSVLAKMEYNPIITEILDILEQNGFNFRNHYTSYKYFEILSLIKNGNTNLLQEIVNRNYISREELIQTDNYFTLACGYGHVDIVEYLLNIGAISSIEGKQKDKRLKNALYMSITMGAKDAFNLHCIDLLLNLGAKVSKKTFAEAICYDRVDIIERFYNHKYDYTKEIPLTDTTLHYKGSNLLMCAVSQRAYKCLKSLLDNVPILDINYKTSHGHSCLELAVTSRNKKMVEILLNDKNLIIDDEIEKMMKEDPEMRVLLDNRI